MLQTATVGADDARATSDHVGVFSGDGGGAAMGEMMLPREEVEVLRALTGGASKGASWEDLVGRIFAVAAAWLRQRRCGRGGDAA